jgi:hypothetical protein
VGEFLRLLNAPCRDIAALVSAGMDADLPWSQRWPVRIHILYCRACRAYRRHLHLLRAILRVAAERLGAQPLPSSADILTLSPEARRRIKLALQAR